MPMCSGLGIAMKITLVKLVKDVDAWIGIGFSFQRMVEIWFRLGELRFPYNNTSFKVGMA